MNVRRLSLLVTYALVTATIASADLDDGLVLYYDFNVDEGTVVTDQSGTGNDGLATGAVHTTEGYLGGGFSFDGVGDSIDAPDSASLDITGPLTISFWMKAPSGDVLRDLIMKNDQANDRAYGLWIQPTDHLSFQTTSDGGAIEYYQMATETTFPLNEWTHVVAVWQGTGVAGAQIYVNGVHAGYSAEVNNFVGSVQHNSSVPFSIGRTYHVHQTYDGLIDEVRLHNRALSEEEIADLYALGSGPSAPFISVLGFSNSEDGEYDVTEFVEGETLYIYVSDVDLDAEDPDVKVEVKLKGQHEKAKTVLEPQEDGSFMGSIELDEFDPGSIRVEVKGKLRHAVQMKRKANIFLSEDE